MMTKNDKLERPIDPADKANGPAAGGVVESLKGTAQEAAAGASRLIGNAENTAQEWASSVGSAAVHAKDRVQDFATIAADDLGDLAKDFTGFIRRHPFESLLVGFGVGVGAGFLAAQLLPRRSA